MQKLDLLNNINRVDVRASLFSEIEQRINQKVIIPMYYVRAAAAVFLCVISLEVFITSNMNSAVQSDTYGLTASDTNTFLDYE